MAAAGALKLSLILTTVDKATSGLRTVAGAMGKVTAAGEKMKKVAESARIARENVDDFTSRAIAGLQSVLAPASDVGSAMSELWLTMDPATRSAEQLERVRQASVDWSMSHVQSAAEFTRATKVMTAESYSQADAFAATEAALRLATATQVDAGAATKGLVTLYKQVGDASKPIGAEYTRLSDVLTSAGQVFQNLNVTEIFDPLKDAAPAAKSAGVSVEQLVTVIGQLNSVGIQGGEAGMGFVNVLNSMAPAAEKLGFSIAKTATGGTDLVGTLRNIEAKFGDVKNMTPETSAALQAAFGPDGFKGLSFMLGQTDKMTAALGRVEGSAGAAAEAQRVLEANTAGQAKIAQNQIDALKIEVAQGLIPAIQALLPAITPVVTAIAGFAREHPGIVSWVGTLIVLLAVAGSVLGPVLSLVGAVASVGGMALTAGSSVVSFAASTMASLVPALGAAITAAWSFTAALLANPITWIVLAIVAAVALIYIYWEPISKFFTALWDGLKSGFVLQWNALVGLWNGVVGFFSGIIDEVKGAFKESFVGGLIKVFMMLNPLYWISRAFAAITPWLLGLWQRWIALVQTGITNVVAGFKEFGPKVLAALAALPGKLVVWYVGLWASIGKLAWDGLKYIVSLNEQLGGWILGALMGMTTALTGFFTGLWNGLSAFVGSIGETIWLGIQKDVQRVLDFLTSINLTETGANIVNTIVAGIKSMASAPVDAMRTIVQKVRNLLPFSPAKDGPLRDLHRVKLVETVADAVRPAPLVNAMSNAAGLAMNAMQAVPMPTFASMPAAVSATTAANRNAASSSGGGDSFTINLDLGGDGESFARFEAWLNAPGNAQKVASAVKRVTGREDRKKFG